MLSIKQLQENNPEFNARLKKTVIKYSVILFIGFSYLIFVLCTGIRIPCLFYEITGLKCPGCGISRMFVSLAKLDFAAAFKFNPFALITGPFVLLYFVLNEIEYVKNGNGRREKLKVFIYPELVAALIYAVIRNIFPI